MDNAQLERYVAQVAEQEAARAVAFKKQDAQHGAKIRAEMTPTELEAFKTGGMEGLAAHQAAERRRNQSRTAEVEEDIIEELPADQFEEVTETDEEGIEVAPDKVAEQLQREEQEKQAEIKRILAEIHAMLEPEVATEQTEIADQARQRFVQSQRLGAPTPEEERIAAALNFRATAGQTMKEQEGLKSDAIDKFIGEAVREQVTVDGQTFYEGQEVVYTDRKDNEAILKVHIPEGLAKGSLALTGMVENKRGKMQKVNFAIDTAAVKTRIDTDVESFKQRQSGRPTALAA